MMITYKSELHAVNTNLAVYLDGKRVGTIKRTKGKNTPEYRYFPKGDKVGGESFASIQAVKDSLKEDKE